MAIQVLGNDAASILGIDATFKAARMSIRPAECLAWASVGAQSGAITGVTANANLFSFRNLSANPVLIRRVGLGFILSTAFSAAQLVDFGLFVARSFSASDSGGTAITISGSSGKHRTSLGQLSSIDCRIATTGALTAGTRTVDANPLSQLGVWGTGIASAIAPALDNLFSHDAGDYPLLLAQNEGFLIQNITAFGATGAGRMYVNFEAAEVTAY
jgi:hypothetical protein